MVRVLTGGEEQEGPGGRCLEGGKPASVTGGVQVAEVMRRAMSSQELLPVP